MAEGILPRAVAGKLARALEALPVVVLSGARQTGKSTLVRSLPALEDHLYLTLDDLDVREQARQSPDALVKRAPRIILDEVQREPELILAVKRAVDRERPRRTGRFVLTGSANLLLAARISETLAGRAAYVTLWPMTRRELLGRGAFGAWDAFFDTPLDDWRKHILSAPEHSADWRDLATLGGYPTPAWELGDLARARQWFEGYVRSYLERDLQDLAAIENLVDFRRLMRGAALRVGNLLNQAELGRDVGIPRATAHRYLNLLEASYQLVRVEPYSVNRTSRLVKSPKVFWSDTGLALFLSGTEPGGAHLENLVLTDLVPWRDGRPDSVEAEVLFWRTRSGREVDFVLEVGGELVGVEVKSSARPRPGDLQGLRAFREEYGDSVRGCLVLHDGDEVSWLSEGILGLPWWRVL